MTKKAHKGVTTWVTAVSDALLSWALQDTGGSGKGASMTDNKSGGGAERGSGVAGRSHFARQRQSAETFDGASHDEESDVDAILAAAEDRDRFAQARDTAANKRDMTANLDAFLAEGGDEKEFEQRSLAQHDRSAARNDRINSAADRDALTHKHPPAT